LHWYLLLPCLCCLRVQLIKAKYQSPKNSQDQVEVQETIQLERIKIPENKRQNSYDIYSATLDNEISLARFRP